MIYLIFYIVIVVMCFTCINHMNKNLFSKGDKVDLPLFKSGSGHKLSMCKIKTNEYLTKLKNSKGADWEKFWE